MVAFGAFVGNECYTPPRYSCGHKLTVQNQTASIAWVLWRRRGSVLGACGVLFGHTLNQSIGADASTFATRKTRSLGARLQIYRAGWSHFHTLAHAPTRRHLTEPVRGSRQFAIPIRRSRGHALIWRVHGGPSDRNSELQVHKTRLERCNGSIKRTAGKGKRDLRDVYWQRRNALSWLF